MAKETMQAVNEAEKNARQTVLAAKEESERLIEQASVKSEQAVADSEKEARKKVEILYGVARADAEKLKAATVKETEEEETRLRESADKHSEAVISEIKKIVLGQS